jgi:hypothetical protein
MRSFGSLHEASILSVLCLSKEIGRYLAAISPPSALVARPAKVSHRPASRPAGLSFSFIRPTRSQLLVYETAHASGTRFVGGATQDSCCFSRRELAVETMLTRRRRGLPTLHQLGCAGRASDVRWWRGGRDRDGPQASCPMSAIARASNRRFALPAAVRHGLVNFAFPVAGPAATRSRTTPSPTGNLWSFQVR